MAPEQDVAHVRLPAWLAARILCICVSAASSPLTLHLTAKHSGRKIQPDRFSAAAHLGQQAETKPRAKSEPLVDTLFFAYFCQFRWEEKSPKRCDSAGDVTNESENLFFETTKAHKNWNWNSEWKPKSFPLLINKVFGLQTTSFHFRWGPWVRDLSISASPSLEHRRLCNRDTKDTSVSIDNLTIVYFVIGCT